LMSTNFESPYGMEKFGLPLLSGKCALDSLLSESIPPRLLALLSIHIDGLGSCSVREWRKTAVPWHRYAFLLSESAKA